MADYPLNFKHLIDGQELLVHVYNKCLLCMAFMVNKAPFEWELAEQRTFSEIFFCFDDHIISNHGKRIDYTA